MTRTTIYLSLTLTFISLNSMSLNAEEDHEVITPQEDHRPRRTLPSMGEGSVPNTRNQGSALRSVFEDRSSTKEKTQRADFPTLERLEECAGDLLAPQCQYNEGQEYACVLEHRKCLRRDKSENIRLDRYLECKVAFDRCRVEARKDYKFNCHDFAFESCRELKKRNYPAWILGLCTKKNAADGEGIVGHAMVVVKDVNAPKEQQPYYCIHEAQSKKFDRNLCETVQMDKKGKARFSKELVDKVKAKVGHYAVICDNSLEISECDNNYYKCHGENPWWVCSPDGNGVRDPRTIPRYAPVRR